MGFSDWMKINPKINSSKWHENWAKKTASKKVYEAKRVNSLSAD